VNAIARCSGRYTIPAGPISMYLYDYMQFQI
jgi:hypothetical protein